MQKPRYEFYSSLNQRLIDALIAGAAFYLAYQIRLNGNVDAHAAYQMWLLLWAIMLGRMAVTELCGTYRIIWRFISLTDSITVVRSYSLFSLILFIFALALPTSWSLLRVPLSIIIIEFLISLTGALGVRALRRVLYERLSSGSSTPKSKKRVLLVGAGRAGALVAKELACRSDIKPMGFLDDDPKKIGRVIGGLRVLGPVSSLVSSVEKYRVEEVVICIARAPRDVLKRLWILCEQISIPTNIVPTIEEILQGKMNIATFRNVEASDLLGRESVELSFTDGELISSYQEKRILITGAGGSIGSELGAQLAKLHPAELILLDKDENGLNDACLRIGTDSGQTLVRPVVTDLCFSERLQNVFSSFHPEIVFHAAAHKHVHLMEMNPCEAILNNVVGTRNLVEQSVASGVSRVVLISTDKAIRPTSIMGASKRVCEMIMQSRQSTAATRFCSVRFGNVIGSRGSVVPIFKNQIARGGPITLTHPEVRRYLMTIPEAVYLLIRAGTLASSGQTFVLEMGEPVLIESLARDLIELSGLRPGRDVKIEITGLRHGEKLTELLFDENKEKLLPTGFDKIHLVEGAPLEPDRVAEKVSALVQAAHRQDVHDIYRILGEFDIGFQGRPRSEPAVEAAKFVPAHVRSAPEFA
jgi:FlaA1/EpsC-like NDP-sugar epimerase